jgi:hypothetical protein
MMGPCRSCRWFDVEAARLGGSRVRASSLVSCNVPRDRIKFPRLSSLPVQFQVPARLPVRLLTCAQYGKGCEFHELPPTTTNEDNQ